MGTEAVFDAERYLRRLGERTIVLGDVHDHPVRGTPVTEAARALVAVDAIDPATAETVADDYRAAGMLRISGGPRLRMVLARRRRPQSSGPAAGPERLVRCRGIVEHPTGTVQVRYARLWAEGVEFGVTIQAPSAQTRHGRRGAFNPGGPAGLTATDDKGTSVGCGFVGSWSEQLARGRLASDAPLSLDTAWLELDGVRLHIDPDPPQPAVVIEPVPDGPAADRYLWHWVATCTRFHDRSGSVDTVLEALIAAGALAVDDPAIDAARYVAEHKKSHILYGKWDFFLLGSCIKSKAYANEKMKPFHYLSDWVLINGRYTDKEPLCKVPGLDSMCLFSLCLYKFIIILKY